MCKECHKHRYPDTDSSSRRDGEDENGSVLFRSNSWKIKMKLSRKKGEARKGSQWGQSISRQGRLTYGGPAFPFSSTPRPRDGVVMFRIKSILVHVVRSTSLASMTFLLLIAMAMRFENIFTPTIPVPFASGARMFRLTSNPS